METQCMGCMEMYDYDLDACPHCGFKESEYKKIGYHLAPHSTLVDTYVVGKAIGYGGFGVTYVGYNAILEKKVAIKEYLPGEFATRSPGDTTVTAFTGDKEQAYYKGLDQFEQEAKRLAKLKNKDGIVDIFDSFRANNTVYIIMECLEGETLKDLIKREKKLSVTKATNIIVAVLEALKEVHEDGIIHRDISPENIFITKAGEVKLIDFGAARNATTGLSKSLSVIVKQGYAPPEQYFSKGKQGTWTDVYATAATYYKMLTGITPDDSMERKGKDSLVPPSKLKVKLSKRQENALLNALELDVKNRTATVDEFLNGLTGEKGKVKRTKVKKEKVDLGKMSLKTKLAIVLGAATVACAFVIGYQVVRDNIISDQESLEDNQVYVPNVLNMSYEEAEAILTQNGLVAKITKREFKNDMPPNIVIEQGIVAGDIVDKGTEISIVISNGGTGTYIENYVGMHKDDVIKKLDEIQMYADFEEIESAAAPGIIVSQDVAYETAVQKGTVIKFQVSTGLNNLGDENVKVPDLVGKTYDECVELLKENKIYIKRTSTTYDANIPVGQIVSQNVAAGTSVKTGTIIEVNVSGGVEKVRIPNVTGSNISETEKRLTDMGLNVVIDYDTYQKGYACTVIGLDVEEGILVDKGTTVTIYGRRGVTFNAYLTYPDKEFGNVYKVGDEIKVTIEMVGEQKGINANWRKEFGFQYNNELLEYKGIEGAGSAKLINNHEEYGDCMMITHSWSGEYNVDTCTLTFEAIKEGTDEIGVFYYQTWMNEEKTRANAHLFTYSNIPYDYTFLQSVDHIVDIEITK
ncbi:MAG: PASTA domain-containing protein [Lachnospiraceae bacterium]|nr:PASTA domain-containing protein [Lachnospiraceae bacterium]